MAVHLRPIIKFLLAAVFCGNFLCICLAVAQSSTQDSTPPAKHSTPHTTTNKKKTASKSSGTSSKRNSLRLHRMHEAFVASSSLKPMARQLLQDRTPAAYAGVEAYARRHTKEDAGSLAWLAVGYAHVLDHDFAKAIDPLSRAKFHAGDFGDYVNYYLGDAYFQTGRLAESIATLSVFEKNYPESLLIRDSHVIYANALVADGRAPEAVELLEKDREPIRADLELILGRAYAAAGEPAKAATVFRNLYYTMPLTGEASQAQTELNKLAATAALPAPTMEQRKTRADLLVKGKQYGEAADEYRAIVDEVSPAERPSMQLAMADALRRGSRNKEAKKALESLPALTPELNAERLLQLGEIARASGDDDGFIRILDQLRQAAPTSPSLEESLLAAGNIYLLRRDYDRAIDYYRELQERFPNSSRASYANWKVAWLNFRQGRIEDSSKGFESQIALYPTSAEIPPALYWRARLAEEENNPAMARAFYQKLYQRYRNYYYGELARQRLARAKVVDVADTPHYALLDRVPPIDTPLKPTLDPLPADDLRVQKAQLLANGALLDFAVRELRAANEKDKGNWLAPEVARLYQDAGRYDMGIEVLKRAEPNYFALDLSHLPRAYWEGLFPKPFWTDVRRFSTSNELDPYLVSSLIRQESAFNPNAVSRANAVGLMQLLPKVGRSVAKQEKLRRYSTSQLFTPAVNVQLGTHYFRSMIDKFGSLEYALAAYNAGSDRVQDWMGQAKYRDAQEFVESIPFTETREYVQAILRNANVYRQLYGAP